jgi:hypothetical protein
MADTEGMTEERLAFIRQRSRVLSGLGSHPFVDELLAEVTRLRTALAAAREDLTGVLDIVLTGLREPMTLADARRVRDAVGARHMDFVRDVLLPAERARATHPTPDTGRETDGMHR